VSSRYKGKPVLPPLDQRKLQELALRYVGKYATTRAKLCSYLARKLRERGWEGDRQPDLEALANRFAELGYIDDASFALAQSRSLSSHGYGKRKITEKLRLAGVEASDGEAANEHADKEAVAAALRFAERRHIGPFASGPTDRLKRERWIAAMVRAGHGFTLARIIAEFTPGAAVDPDDLKDRAGMFED
jgi:regulatory protein